MKEELKIFELAREMEMKHTELIPILNALGHEIKGFSKIVSREFAERLKEEVKQYYIKQDLDAKDAIEAARLASNEVLANKLARHLEYKQANVAKLIGTYFCPIKRRYFIVEVEQNPEEVKLKGDGYGSIYNLKHDFEVRTTRLGIHRPAELSNHRRWGDFNPDEEL